MRIRVKKKVRNFRYLGSMVARSVNNFQRRRALMWSALWSLGKMWYSQTISLDLKLPLFRTCLSVLSYGCETWIITRDIGMKLNDFASSCCRFILTIKRLDEISNDRIYNLNGISPLLLMVVSHFAHGEGWTCWHLRIVWRCMSLLMGEDPVSISSPRTVFHPFSQDETKMKYGNILARGRLCQ